MPPHLEEAFRALRLADRDIEAFDVLRKASHIHSSIIGFHAQQAIEKSLKAVLFAHQVEFERTHDLVRLSYLLRQSAIEPPLSDNSLRRLNPFAVMMRYDDWESEENFVDETAVWLQTIRDWAGKQVEIIVRQAS